MNKLLSGFFMVLVYRGRSIFFLSTWVKRMGVVCRGSEKYFALMSCRFSAELAKRLLKGNVNSFYCWWVYYRGWLLLGFPVLNLSFWSKLKPSVLLSCSLKIYVTKLTWNCISLLLRQANGSSYARNNFDFDVFQRAFLKWCKMFPPQTFRTI